jgi:hypothetical protein
MVARETLSTDDLFEAASMAPSTTIIPFTSHGEDTQAAVSHWLDQVAMAGVRLSANDTDGEARASILRQAATTMLARVEPRTRAITNLLR